MVEEDRLTFRAIKFNVYMGRYAVVIKKKINKIKLAYSLF